MYPFACVRLSVAKPPSTDQCSEVRRVREIIFGMVKEPNKYARGIVPTNEKDKSSSNINRPVRVYTEDSYNTFADPSFIFALSSSSLSLSKSLMTNPPSSHSSSIPFLVPLKVEGGAAVLGLDKAALFSCTVADIFAALLLIKLPKPAPHEPRVCWAWIMVGVNELGVDGRGDIGGGGIGAVLYEDVGGMGGGGVAERCKGSERGRRPDGNTAVGFNENVRNPFPGGLVSGAVGDVGVVAAPEVANLVPISLRTALKKPLAALWMASLVGPRFCSNWSECIPS
jgi:hypothetical protein